MKRALLIVAGLVGLAVVGGVAWFGPRNAIGLIRYGRIAEGALKPGDRAADVTLVGLDGVSRHSLTEFVGGRPLVVIFGSFT